MEVDNRELIRKLIVDDGIRNIKDLIKQTGLSRNRIYEIRKKIGLGKRSAKVEEIENHQNSAITNVADVPSENSAYIPNANNYVKRVIHGKTDIQIMEQLYKLKTPLLIIGDTGTGKSISARHFCLEKKLPYMRVNFNGAMTPEDLIGQFIPNKEGGFKWCDGVLTKFVRFGGVFVVDEINSGHADILFFLHPLLDDERKLVLVQNDGEVIKAHKDFWLVATMNPDYEGTKPLNLALADRFAVLEFDYDDNVEKTIIRNSKLLNFAEKVRKLYRAGEISCPLSTRTLIRYEQNINIFGSQIAKMLMLNNYKPTERTAIREVFDLEMSAVGKIKKKAKSKDNGIRFV